MESLLISNTLRLAAHLCLPLFIAVLIGALVSGIVRVATQIDDPAIGFAGRFAAVAAFLYFSSLSMSKEVVDFALRIWGGGDFYH
jgi:flagellar biosynthesis protein FliQ